MRAALENVLAGIPNPPPIDPTYGGKGISLLLSYVKYGALAFTGAVAVVSLVMGLHGHFADRPGQAAKGWWILAACVAAAVGIALGIPLVNGVFSAAS